MHLLNDSYSSRTAGPPDKCRDQTVYSAKSSAGRAAVVTVTEATSVAVVVPQ